jgi:hypothetical protein
MSERQSWRPPPGLAEETRTESRSSKGAGDIASPLLVRSDGSSSPDYARRLKEKKCNLLAPPSVRAIRSPSMNLDGDFAMSSYWPRRSYL